ncbi:MAG: hypothetical protein D6744_12535 [Planctomycetota bacterium]|nr:MAG: hypothetical protein D6744_12535 [Planctomycetota bacterium]
MEAPPAAKRPDEIARDVRTRLLMQRHWRFLRSVALVIVMTGVMLFAAIHTRDTQTRKQSARLGRALAAAMQERFDQTHRPPRDLPPLPSPEQTRLARARYTLNLFYAEQIRTARSVAACYPRGPLSMALRETGRHVVFFDGKRFESRWVPEDEFRRRASSWGVLLPAE